MKFGLLKRKEAIEIPYERVQAVGDILLISPEIVETPANPQDIGIIMNVGILGCGAIANIITNFAVEGKLRC